MCSLAPRAAAPAGFGATAFLDRKRGVAAAAMAPAATSGHKAGAEPDRRARTSEALARKRGRHDAGFEHVVVDRPAASSELRIRMDKELVALQGLLKRAKLMPRSAPAENNKHEAPSSAAKRTTSQSKAATQAAPACQTQTKTAPAANSKQQLPVQRAAAKNHQIAPEVPNKKQQPAEAAERRPDEKELAERAAARDAFRQMLLEVERSALPDQTISPEELKALGIPWFEFVVTRTWKQAWLDYQAKKKKKKKLESVGV